MCTHHDAPQLNFVPLYLAVRLSGFKDHNFCFAEADCELAFLTVAGRCVNDSQSPLLGGNLLLESFWASGHQNEIISIHQY